MLIQGDAGFWLVTNVGDDYDLYDLPVYSVLRPMGQSRVA